MARRWTVAAGACLATALLAGCSSSTQQASTTLPTTTAPNASASPTPPPLGPPDFPVPAQARVRTADGFNEFTRYYLALVNRLDTNLDTTYLRQFSRGCATCNRIAADAESDAAKGYRYEGGTLTITAQAPAHLTDAGAENAFTADQAAYTVVDSSGRPLPELAGAAIAHMAAGAQGVWSNDHWVITNLSFG